MACTEKGFWVAANPPSGHGEYGVKVSKGFTGKRGDRQFYRGKLWLGPSNSVGHMPQGAALLETQEKGTNFGLMPITSR